MLTDSFRHAAHRQTRASDLAPVKQHARILLIERERAIDTIVPPLVRSGHRVEWSGDPAEALRRLGRANYDLIIASLDALASSELPQYGQELQEGQPGQENHIGRLVASSVDRPVLAIVDNAHTEQALAAIGAGAYDFVLREQCPAALMPAIERALECRALRREIRALRGSGADGGIGARSSREASVLLRALAKGGDPEQALQDVRDLDLQRLPTVSQLERDYIIGVLEAVAGNKTRAARVLGLDRRTLYRKLDRYRRQHRQAMHAHRADDGGEAHVRSEETPGTTLH